MTLRPVLREVTVKVIRWEESEDEPVETIQFTGANVADVRRFVSQDGHRFPRVEPKDDGLGSLWVFNDINAYDNRWVEAQSLSPEMILGRYADGMFAVIGWGDPTPETEALYGTRR